MLSSHTQLRRPLLSASIARSGRRLRALVAESTDVTFVRSFGNTGDLLIERGILRLLDGLFRRDIGVLELDGIQGETAVIAGGGAWCAPFHEVVPGALREVERRFRRVIVLPSSFDVSVPTVRDALRDSGALVFARERVSHAGIRSLCRSVLAHDCALYFDFDPYRAAGSGILNAFRTDQESALLGQGFALPKDNVDVSVTIGDLDEWLQTIARYEVIRTDRAHVMIAGSMLGKSVEYLASAYHKVPAIAEHSLRNTRVRPLLQTAFSWPAASRSLAETAT